MPGSTPTASSCTRDGTYIAGSASVTLGRDLGTVKATAAGRVNCGEFVAQKAGAQIEIKASIDADLTLSPQLTIAVKGATLELVGRKCADPGKSLDGCAWVGALKAS